MRLETLVNKFFAIYLLLAISLFAGNFNFMQGTDGYKMDKTGGISKEKILKQFNYLKGLSDSQRDKREDFLLGIAYLNGLKDIHLKVDYTLARKYFMRSFEKGFAMASPYAIYTDIKGNMVLQMQADIKYFMYAKNSTKLSKFAILKMVSVLYIQGNDFKDALPYLRMLSSKYNDSGSAVMLAVIYERGLNGSKPDSQMANYFLNKGCNSPKLNKMTKVFCEQFKK